MHQVTQRASDFNVKPSGAKRSGAERSQAKRSAPQRTAALSIVNGKLLSRRVQWKNVETSPYQQVAVVNIHREVTGTTKHTESARLQCGCGSVRR